MTQPSKTGRMISALDLANRIVADAERYHAAMDVLPFITMSSGASFSRRKTDDASEDY